MVNTENAPSEVLPFDTKWVFGNMKNNVKDLLSITTNQIKSNYNLRWECPYFKIWSHTYVYK